MQPGHCAEPRGPGLLGRKEELELEEETVGRFTGVSTVADPGVCCEDGRRRKRRKEEEQWQLDCNSGCQGLRSSHCFCVGRCVLSP